MPRKNAKRNARRADVSQRTAGRRLHDTFEGQLERAVVDEVVAACGGDKEAAFAVLFSMAEEAAPVSKGGESPTGGLAVLALGGGGGGGGGGDSEGAGGGPDDGATAASKADCPSGTYSGDKTVTAGAPGEWEGAPPSFADAVGRVEGFGDEAGSGAGGDVLSRAAAWECLVDMFASGDAAGMNIDQLMTTFDASEGDIVLATEAILAHMQHEDEESSAFPALSGTGKAVGKAKYVPFGNPWGQSAVTELKRAGSVSDTSSGHGGAAAGSQFLDFWFGDHADGASEAARAADARMRELFVKAANAHRSMHPAVAGEYAAQAREMQRRRTDASMSHAAKVFRAKNSHLTRAHFGSSARYFPAVDCHGQTVDSCLKLVKQLIRHACAVRVCEFTIITGVGNHSAGNARLHPTLKRFLDSRGISFTYTDGKFAIRVDPRRHGSL